MTNEALFRLFSKFGNVISARIMVEKATGRSRGFGKPLAFGRRSFCRLILFQTTAVDVQNLFLLFCEGLKKNLNAATAVGMYLLLSVVTVVTVLYCAVLYIRTLTT